LESSHAQVSGALNFYLRIMPLKKAIIFTFTVFLHLALNGQHCVSQRYSETAVFDSADVVVLQNIQYESALQYFTGQDTPQPIVMPSNIRAS
jgi:hypothetical protein